MHLSTLGAGAIAAAMVSTIHLQDSGGLWGRYVDESRISLIHRHRPKEVLIVLALGIVMTATAKSLLRYPELREHDGVDVHAVTEYVLIGSLMSWTIAFAGAVLLA